MWVIVVMMMVMAMVNDNHHLRLRPIRDCEAEEEHEAEQSLFHDSQCGAWCLRILSYCDQCLQRTNELIKRAWVMILGGSLTCFLNLRQEESRCPRWSRRN